MGLYVRATVVRPYGPYGFGTSSHLRLRVQMVDVKAVCGIRLYGTKTFVEGTLRFRVPLKHTRTSLTKTLNANVQI